jgi:hypothetical protein
VGSSGDSEQHLGKKDKLLLLPEFWDMLHQRIPPPKQASLQLLPAQLFPKLNNRINKSGSNKFMKFCANNETISEKTTLHIIESLIIQR